MTSCDLTAAKNLLVATSGSRRAVGSYVRRHGRLERPAFLLARVPRTRHRGSVRGAALTPQEVSRPNSQETRLSPPAGRASSSAGQSSSRSARTPLLCFGRGYADPTPQTRPAPRCECARGLSAEIGAALSFATSRGRRDVRSPVADERSAGSTAFPRKRGAPRRAPQISRAGLCPVSGSDLRCAGKRVSLGAWQLPGVVAVR